MCVKFSQYGGFHVSEGWMELISCLSIWTHKFVDFSFPFIFFSTFKRWVGQSLNLLMFLKCEGLNMGLLQSSL